MWFDSCSHGTSFVCLQLLFSEMGFSCIWVFLESSGESQTFPIRQHILGQAHQARIYVTLWNWAGHTNLLLSFPKWAILPPRGAGMI